jgi:hypothetical protein
MNAELKNGKLVIPLDAETKNPAKSASGKSKVVASTRGNVRTSIVIDGQNLILGVNAYIANA